MQTIRNYIDITDHALVRYRQRFGHISRRQLEKQVRRSRPVPAEWGMPETQHKIALTDGRAVYLLKKKADRKNNRIYLATVLRRCFMNPLVLQHTEREA